MHACGRSRTDATKIAITARTVRARACERPRENLPRRPTCWAAGRSAAVCMHVCVYRDDGRHKCTARTHTHTLPHSRRPEYVREQIPSLAKMCVSQSNAPAHGRSCLYTILRTLHALYVKRWYRYIMHARHAHECTLEPTQTRNKKVVTLSSSSCASTDATTVHCRQCSRPGDMPPNPAIQTRARALFFCEHCAHCAARRLTMLRADEPALPERIVALLKKGARRNRRLVLKASDEPPPPPYFKQHVCRSTPMPS